MFVYVCSCDNIYFQELFTHMHFFIIIITGGNGQTYNTNVSGPRNARYMEPLQYTYTFRYLGTR